MAKIITVTNRKGGVGKTTMAVHIAAGLAMKGEHVGLIDTDSQGHAGRLLNIPEINGLYDVMVNRSPLSEVVQHLPRDHYQSPSLSPRGELFLLPSGDKTFKIPFELDQGEAFAFLELVDDFIKQFALTVVVVDTNPTMSMLDGMVYMATDGFILVTECEALSFDGIEDASKQISRINKGRERFLGRSSQLIGVIPNMMRPDTVLHRTNVGELKQVYGELVWSPVTLRIAWPSAAQLRELIYIYEPDGQAAHDAWYVTEQTAKAIGLCQTIETE